jgi:hypothetical protein
MRWTGAGWGLMLGLAVTPLASRADNVSPTSAGRPPPGTRAGHEIQLTAHSGASLHLSAARTIGGVGGGVGVRDIVGQRLVLQGDASYLVGLGNVVGIRLAAGLQRRGFYTPAALVAARALLGSRISFLTPDHPAPRRTPAATVGLVAAPLRFRSSGYEVSFFELGVGIGSDFPGVSRVFELRLLEVAAALWP